MAVGWQELRFGTLVVATVAIAGTTIYQFAEHALTRRTVQPQDIIELVEGVQERERAAYVRSPWSEVLALGVMTQDVRRWSVSGVEYDVPNGTNAPLTNNYLTYDGEIELVLTNIVVGVVVQETHTFTTGRLVWAGWSNLNVTTFDDSTVTGGYTLASYAWRDDGSGMNGLVGYYTNLSRLGSYEWVVLDIRDRELSTALQSARGWMIWRGIVTAVVTTNADLSVTTSVNPPSEWTFSTAEDLDTYYTTTNYFDSFRGSNIWHKNLSAVQTGIVESVGALTHSDIRDAPAVYSEARINAINWQKPSSNFWHIFDTALTNINMVTKYVKEMNPSNGVIFWSVEDLFDELNIGDGTNLFTQTVTSGVPVFGAIGMKLMKTNLIERYQFLQAMSQTVAVATYSTITTNSGSNVVFTSILDSGAGPYLPIIAGPREPAAPNYFVEPIYDSWITNASGTLIPTEWIPFTVTVSFPWFDQAYFNRARSRIFDGTFSESASNVVVTTNTVAPWHLYKWYYRYDMASQVEWSAPPTQGYTQTITKLSQSFDTLHGDWSSNLLDTTRFQTLFETDLTGATYSIDYYLLNADRTNVHSTMVFPTGDWHFVLSDQYEWTNDVVKTNLSSAFSHDASDFVISSNVGLGSRTIARATNSSGATPWWGRSYAATESDTNHAAAVLYFGRRTISNRAIVRWTFKNAPP